MGVEEFCAVPIVNIEGCMRMHRADTETVCSREGLSDLDNKKILILAENPCSHDSLPPL